jgi:hypothetical protein
MAGINHDHDAARMVNAVEAGDGPDAIAFLHQPSREEEAMSTEDTIRTQLDAFNRRDANAFTGCYAAQAKIADPQYEEPLKGAEAISKDVAAWFGAFPDIEARISR